MIEIGIVAPLVGLGGLLAALIAYILVVRQSPGTAKMTAVSDEISLGTMTFLKAEYAKIFIVVLVMTALAGWALSPLSAAAVVSGAIASALAGWIGIRAASRGNVRTAAAADDRGLAAACLMAFNSGSVMGFAVSGLGLAALGGLFFSFSGESDQSQILVGFAIGAAIVSLFARIAGGIFTKAADVGSDLVGKLEAGIPEDDPRNPGVIADNVGDLVGEVGGTGADLFESYSGAMVAAMVIAALLNETEIKSLFPGVPKEVLVGFPLLLGTIGLAASLLGVFCMNILKNVKATVAMTIADLFACLVFAGGTAGVVFEFEYGMELLGAVLVGTAVGFCLSRVAQLSTSSRRVKQVAESTRTGAATNVIAGFAVGLESCGLPLLLLGLGIFGAFELGGVYGIAIAAVGVTSTVGLRMAFAAFAPIADNAGGIAQMSHLSAKTCDVTDSLDAIGNTASAISKNFAIGASAFTSIALFLAFKHSMRTSGVPTIIEIGDPRVLIGFLLGAFVILMAASRTLKSAGRAASLMVEEIRRQFREIPGLLNGTGQPDTSRCIEISTQSALKEMILPASLGVVIPLAVGFGLGTESLAGLILGALMSGIVFAFTLSNAGQIWDHAKKYIEAGGLDGEKKGSEPHAAAVIGDTVGDPFKDATAPAISVLMKLLAAIALFIAPLLY